MIVSNILKWLRFSKQGLLLALLRINAAKVEMPMLHIIQVFKEVIWGRITHC
jgi:hypothetical protein